MSVAIVDVGMGNVGSVANMLAKIGAHAVRTDDGPTIADAAHIVLPGVGSFDVAMQRLHERGLVDVLHRRVDAGVPLLGICLGMHLLGDSSAEGTEPGLGWISGRVARLDPEPGDRPRPVPHMGWNEINVADGTEGADLFDALDDDARFYFVHSFALQPDRGDHVLATTDYGGPFVSAVMNGNVRGVQFHPEKSHRHGMAVLRRFVERAPCRSLA